MLPTDPVAKIVSARGPFEVLERDLPRVGRILRAHRGLALWLSDDSYRITAAWHRDGTPVAAPAGFGPTGIRQERPSFVTIVRYTTLHVWPSPLPRPAVRAKMLARAREWLDFVKSAMKWRHPGSTGQVFDGTNAETRERVIYRRQVCPFVCFKTGLFDDHPETRPFDPSSVRAAAIAAL